jgi:hypothetical protein
MRKRFLIIAVAIIAVLTIVVAFAANQELISMHKYPRQAIHKDSNLSIKGIVLSIEDNYRAYGWDYHIFRLYIQLNITEIAWMKDELTGWVEYSFENTTINDSHIIGIGYDNPDDLQLIRGEPVECKGYYETISDYPWTHILTVAPSINGSYLKQLMLY